MTSTAPRRPGWADFAGHKDVRDLILAGPIDIFEAIDFDLPDRIPEILARDPGALDAAVSRLRARRVDARRGRLGPDTTPLAWAVAQNKVAAARVARSARQGRFEAATGRAGRDVPPVRLLGSSRPRQGRPPDARPRRAAAAGAASRHRARQPLHRDRVRRLEEVERILAERRRRRLRARRLPRLDAAPLSLLTRASPTRRRSTTRSRSRGCCSIAARTRTTSTWRATPGTRRWSARPAKASRTRRGSRTRGHCSSCCSSAAPSRSTSRSSTTRISAAT